MSGLTAEHHKALGAVVDAADALAKLGWPVNWQQNEQAILEPTEYGFCGGKLVDRFSSLPKVARLGEELHLL